MVVAAKVTVAWAVVVRVGEGSAAFLEMDTTAEEGMALVARAAVVRVTEVKVAGVMAAEVTEAHSVAPMVEVPEVEMETEKVVETTAEG